MTYRLIEGMVHRRQEGQWEPLSKEEANELLARLDDESDEPRTDHNQRRENSQSVH